MSGHSGQPRASGFQAQTADAGFRSQDAVPRAKAEPPSVRAARAGAQVSGRGSWRPVGGASLPGFLGAPGAPAPSVSLALWEPEGLHMDTQAQRPSFPWSTPHQMGVRADSLRSL